MMRALYTGASGVKIHQTKMDVIGNNISNINTTGFKAGRPTFADMFSQTLSGATSGRGSVGGTNPKQIGLGGSVSAIDVIHTDGAPLDTGKNTDLALCGDAMFVVKRGNDTYYTRDGAFEFDADGNYVLPGNGYFVQGWTATDGVIDTSGAIDNITVTKGQVMEAKATDLVDYYDNLNSDIPMILEIKGGETNPDTNITVASFDKPVTLTLNDGTTSIMTEGSYKAGNSMPVTTVASVYDGLGDKHEIPLYFTREGEIEDGVLTASNKWLISLTPDPAVQKGDTQTSEFIDANGNTATLTFNAAEIQFDSSGGFITDAESDTVGTMTLEFEAAPTDADVVDPTAPDATDVTPAAAATTQTVSIDFTGLTQYSGSTTLQNHGNGNSEGILKEIQIDDTGTIMGIYTNGKTQAEAQVATAHFTNMPGLTKMGVSRYQVSDNSGAPTINSADTFGASIRSGALEMSNVDLATEFAEMIIGQRGFQSNTKVVTVTDEMIETAINMKQR